MLHPVLLLACAAVLLNCGCEAKQAGPGLTDHPLQGERIVRLDGEWDLSSSDTGDGAGYALKATVSKQRGGGGNNG